MKVLYPCQPKSIIQRFDLSSILKVLGLLLFFIGGGEITTAQNNFERNTPGNYTFTVPSGVTQLTVEVWGAGGGGGGNRGSGGGGGGYASKLVTVAPGDVISYTVGAGGAAGGTNGNQAGAGGASRITLPDMSVITAHGGSGGAGNRGAAGVGGSASGGTVNLTGSNGNSFQNNGNGGAGANGGAGGYGSTDNVGGNGTHPGGAGGGGGRRGDWIWITPYSGGVGANGRVRFSYPAYQAQFISSHIGGENVWEMGTPRSVFVTVTNTGNSVWTNNNPDVNIGVKWNAESDYFVRVDADNLAPGETRTYSLVITAPMSIGVNNLSFDVVNEGVCWFANNNGACGPGNEVHVSENISIVPSVNRYYSYQSGSWNDANTWTQDPSGTLSVNPGVPGEFDLVTILSGRNVSIPNNGQQVNSLEIQRGGTLDLRATTGHNFKSVSGEGTMRLQTNNFPSGDFSSFTSQGGGTVEYYNPSANFNLQHLTYNHLIFDFSNTGLVATLGGNLTINGDLSVKRGRFQIGNNHSSRTVQVNGNVLVDNNGHIQLGTGNANHRFIVNGDFTNYGVVRFTNQSQPNYISFPNDGRADVVFNNPAADQSLLLAGQSDFYRIEIDKGIDHTFVLNIDATNENNFKLFGRNNQEPSINVPNINNPHALGLLAGTVRLGRNIVIPSLATDRYYVVDEDAMLWLDGANVTYGTGNTGAETVILLYGTLKVSGNSVLNDNGKQGIVSRETASLIIEGGEVTTNHVRTSYQAGRHRGAFNMSGGVLNINSENLPNLSGMEIYPAFTWPYPDNTINITGGTINVLSPNVIGGGAGSNFSVLIGADPNNVSITGGEVNITVLDNRNAYILSTAPLWDLNIISASNAVSAQIRNYAGSNRIPAVAAQSLQVKNNLTLVNRARFTSGNANSDVLVGGNFVINTNTTYTPGTNSTIFNGDGPQTFTNNGTVTTGFNHLELSGKSDLTLNGANIVSVRGNLTLGAETILRDNGRTVTVAGNIINSGTHFRPVSGAGRIELVGNASQTLSGNGNGVFNNLSINKSGGVVHMEATSTVTGDLRLVNNHRLVIGDKTLKLGEFAQVYSAATGSAQAFNNNKMIVTDGLMSSGGVQKQFSNSETFLYPFGFAVEGTHYYMPATIKFETAPTQWGAITSRPVNGRHHLAQGANNALNAYWKTTSSGFEGIASNSIIHTYKYLQNFVQGDESSYIPAVYNYGTSWRTINDVNLVNQATDVITFNAESSANGDYTAGLSSAFEGIPVLYSRNGGGDWNNPNTWSEEGVNGATSGNLPSASTIVVVGDSNNDHTVTMTNSGNSAGALFIAGGSTLDLRNTNGHNFAALPEEIVAGSGTLRIASSNYFPIGDFGEFLGENGGTVEYYTIDANVTVPTVSAGGLALNSYRNLKLTHGNNNIIMPNRDIVVHEDLMINGTGTGSVRTNDNNNWSNYTIKGDLLSQSGRFYYRQGAPKTISIFGDLHISENALFSVRTDNPNTNQNLELYGNLINNGGFNMHQGNSRVNVYFKGEENAVVEGSGTLFNFYNLFVDKGLNAEPVLTLKSAITTGVTNPFLTLLNGTFRVENENLTVVVTDGTTDFSIPSTAALSVQSGTVGVAYGNGNANLLLTGKLEVLGGKMEIGNAAFNRNNSIEYAAAGKPEIFVSGGELYVNGQVRRPSTTTSGSLNYIQSGGEVLIAGRGRMANRGMLEVANAGSLFNMSGGTLALARPSVVGTTFGDLYLRPSENNVTGGTIQLGVDGNAAAYHFALQASTPIWNLSVGNANTSQRASLNVLPLVVKNNLSISNNSRFMANGLDVSIAGSLINNNISSTRGLAEGGFQPGVNSQVTRFNGTGSQFIQGVGTNVTNFANLEINATNVTLASNSSLSVNNNLSILSGQLNDGGNIIAVANNIYNVGTHVSNSLNGGISIEGNRVQIISGHNAVFGNILMNNSKGVNVISNATINGQLTFNAGSIYVDDYLLTFGQNASVAGTLDNQRMIKLNGALSDLGVRKLFAAGASPEFVFPIGVKEKYTPAAYTITANSAPGSITLRPIDEKHAAVADANLNELDYYWSVKSSGFGNLSVQHQYHYIQDDVQATEAQYVGGRYDYENYTWYNLGNVVDVSSNTISFESDYITGEYTAGYASNFITKPVLYSRGSGNWSDGNTWSLSPGGGPSGLSPDGNPVIIAADHVITLDINSAYTYSVEIEGALVVGTTLYHNLGHFSGSGTMCVTSTSEGIFVLPGGRFDEFFGNPNSTLEFRGDNAANLPVRPGNIYKPFQNVVLSGTGPKNIGSENIKINGSLTIKDGTVLNNSNYNRIVYIGGDWIDENEVNQGFIAGRGTVVFDGNTVQNFNVKRAELFYNVTMNSSGMLDLSQSETGTSLQVSNKLTLTKGVIKSYEDKQVQITNTATNAVAGGNANSYVDGPLVKSILLGQSFVFPVGHDGRYGRMAVQNTQGGTSPANWTVQYFNNNPYPKDEENLNVPITSVSSNEHWVVNRPPGAAANIQLRWDNTSYPGATSDALLRNNLRVVQYNSSEEKWSERGQVVNASNRTVSTSTRVTSNDYIFTLGLSGVTATITDFSDVEICDNNEVASIPVVLTGSAPWTLNYRVTGATTRNFSQTGITSPNYFIQLTGADLAGAGSYQVSLVSVSDHASAGVANAGEVNVTVLPTYTPVITGAAMVGRNETRTYSTPQNGINTYSWSWVGASGGIIESPNASTTNIAFGDVSGVYQLLVEEVTATSGCIASTIYAIEVTTVPVPNIEPKLPNICVGEVVTYTTAPISGNQYRWTVTGGTIQTTNATNWRSGVGANTISVLWNTPGSASIKVEERIGTGTVMGETTELIEVSPSIANRSVFADDAEICHGSTTFIRVANSEVNVSYRIKDLATNTYMGPSVGGTGSDLLIPTDNLLHSESPYQIAVVASNLACELELTNKPIITVKPEPVVVLTSDAEDALFCFGTSVAFEATTGFGNYIFSVNDVEVQSGTSNLFTSSSFAGGDVVKVRAMNAEGCYGVSNSIALQINPVGGVWSGSKNSDWSDPDNWCNGVVPAQNTSLTITGGTHAPELSGVWQTSDLTVAENGVLNIMPGAVIDVNGNLSVHSSGQLILKNNSSVGGLVSFKTHGSVTGKADVELALPSNQWYYLASPMKNVTYSHFGSEDSDARVYIYRNRWIEYDRNGTNFNFLPLEGASTYAVTDTPKDLVINYSGELNNTPVARELTARGYYLFGNPYPTSINWQDENWARDRIYGTFWYRTRVNSEMAFITYNRFAIEGARAATYPDNVAWGNDEEMALIPPYQSVWVYSKTASAANPVNLVAYPAQRVHGPGELKEVPEDVLVGGTLKSSKVKSASQGDIVRIVVKNDKSRDGAVIYFSSNTTDGFDPGDSPKYFNSSPNIPEVYTRSAGQSLAINGLELFEGALDIPLIVRNRIEGIVDMSFDLSLYKTNDVIVLHDKYLDKEIDLRKNATYRYEPTQLGDDYDRFVLRFNPPELSSEDPATGLISQEGAQEQAPYINIVGLNGRAIVSISRELLKDGQGDIEVYNVAGAKISEFKASTSKTFIVLPEAQGVYLVVVKAGGVTKSKKLAR